MNSLNENKIEGTLKKVRECKGLEMRIMELFMDGKLFSEKHMESNWYKSIVDFYKKIPSDLEIKLTKEGLMTHRKSSRVMKILKDPFSLPAPAAPSLEDKEFTFFEPEKVDKKGVGIFESIKPNSVSQDEKSEPKKKLEMLLNRYRKIKSIYGKDSLGTVYKDPVESRSIEILSEAKINEEDLYEIVRRLNDSIYDTVKSSPVVIRRDFNKLPKAVRDHKYNQLSPVVTIPSPGLIIDNRVFPTIEHYVYYRLFMHEGGFTNIKGKALRGISGEQAYSLCRVGTNDFASFKTLDDRYKSKKEDTEKNLTKIYLSEGIGKKYSINRFINALLETGFSKLSFISRNKHLKYVGYELTSIRNNMNSHYIRTWSRNKVVMDYIDKRLLHIHNIGLAFNDYIKIGEGDWFGRFSEVLKNMNICTSSKYLHSEACSNLYRISTTEFQRKHMDTKIRVVPGLKQLYDAYWTFAVAPLRMILSRVGVNVEDAVCVLEECKRLFDDDITRYDTISGSGKMNVLQKSIANIHRSFQSAGIGIYTDYKRLTGLYARMFPFLVSDSSRANMEANNFLTLSRSFENKVTDKPVQEINQFLGKLAATQLAKSVPLKELSRYVFY